MDSNENITNTLEVLQTELNLSLKDIKAIQSRSLPAILSYPRSELRKRILVYKLDLQYPTEQITKMVLKDPRMLRTDSTNVRQILRVLSEELNIERDDVHAMLRKEILLLTYNAKKNIRPTIRYLKENEVGLCLGMVDRKGISTLKGKTTMGDADSHVSLALSKEERDSIVKDRLKQLVMGHPKILSSSIDKNLKPTVQFFLREVGLSPYEFGRVVYRRGGSLLEANVERTLRRKVDFLRSELDLEVSNRGDDNAEEIDNAANVTVQMRGDAHDANLQNIVFEQVSAPSLPMSDNASPTIVASQGKTTFTSRERRRLLAQMLATNPDILTLSIENNLQPKLDYFRHTIGLSIEQTRYIMLKRPQLLALSLERNIIPKIEFFMESRDENEKNVDRYSGGLGMEMEEIRTWITQYPQTLTFVLDSRIKPRTFDVVRLGLRVGSDSDDGMDTDEIVVPMNFITRSERSWKKWIDDHITLADE